MSSRDEHLFGELRSMLERTPKDEQWGEELLGLLGRARAHLGAEAYEERWVPYLRGARLGSWPMTLLTSALIDEIAHSCASEAWEQMNEDHQSEAYSWDYVAFDGDFSYLNEEIIKLTGRSVSPEEVGQMEARMRHLYAKKARELELGEEVMP